MSDTALDASTVSALATRIREVTSMLADSDANFDDLPSELRLALGRVASALPLQRHPDAVRTMSSYCAELDDIAAALLALDNRQLELEAQLTWWNNRIAELDAQRLGPAAGTPAENSVAREQSLFRGRIAGAQTMLRHYAHERSSLTRRHSTAHRRCADALDALLVT